MNNKIKMILAFAMIVMSAAKSHANSSDDMNVTFSPILPLIGTLMVEVEKTISSDWTLGGMAAAGKRTEDSDYIFGGYETTTRALGVTSYWYKNGVYTDGLFLNPSLYYSAVTLKTTDRTLSADGSAFVASFVAGYGWFWDSFNMKLGGGLASAVGGVDVTVRDQNGNSLKSAQYASGLVLVYNIGWTF